MKLIRKFLILSLLFIVSLLPACAKEELEILAPIVNGFHISDIQSELSVNIPFDIPVTEELVLPENAILTAEILKTQKELRWHKNAYILCKLKNFKTASDEQIVDLSDKEIYMVAKKHQRIDKKDAIITGTEIVTASAASFIFPGVDIVYFFTKGAIQREKHPNWFKAGVSNAYENSIFWFCLKGRNVELEDEDLIEMKEISEKKAARLSAKIDKRHKHDEIQLARQAQRQAIHTSRKKLKISGRDDTY